MQHLPEKNILECPIQFYRQIEKCQHCETVTGFTGLSGLWESSCCRLVGGQGRLQASEVGMVGEGALGQWCLRWRGSWREEPRLHKEYFGMWRLEHICKLRRKYASKCALVAQSCPTLCSPMDYSLPGSSIHEDSPGKNTEVGCHALLQGIFPTQRLNLGLLHYRQILYRLSHQGSWWRRRGRSLKSKEWDD